MKTLIIVSHPSLNESASQQFLVNSINYDKNVTIHHLEEAYPDGKINRESEQELLKEHQRIIFQFPFYWYSSPPLLKEWQDVVFAGDYFYNTEGTILTNKEFGLVLTVGVKEEDYRAGGREGFTIDELTRPFQAVANHLGMCYLPAMTIHQFAYLSEGDKKALLVAYHYYLTGAQPASLDNRTSWLISQLELTDQNTLPEDSEKLLETIIEAISEQQSLLDDLKATMADF